jgi:hypothetical protein
LKLSIFPKCKPLCYTKEDKNIFAKYVSFPHEAVTVEANNDDDLIQYITSFAWSPFVYSKYRKSENFISTDMMVLDIDTNLTIGTAEERCNELGYCFLILPTANHSEEKHKFRIIFPLVRTTTSSQEYFATWNYLKSKFPELDKQCSDLARYYFASTLDDGCFVEGKLLEPTKVIDNSQGVKEWKWVDAKAYEGPDVLEELYGVVPEQIHGSVEFFLKNAHTGLPGEWICSLNECVYTLALQNIDPEKIVSVIKSVAPAPLDKRDIQHIEIALRDASKILHTEENKLLKRKDL